MKTCKIEGCSNKVWSAGLCLRHTPKKPLKSKKKSIKKISAKGEIKKQEKKERTKKLHTWFQELWESEPHYSEISGEFLGYENNSCFWHHIYPKSTYEEYEFDRDNIMRITANEHARIEAGASNYELLYEKKQFLKQKYGK